MQCNKLADPFITGIKILMFLVPAVIIQSCTGSIPEQKEPVVKRTELNIPVIADTVIYDVVVRNPNPDDFWVEESLRNLNREALVDIIFKLIYSRELIPYDYFSQKALSAGEIRELEDSPEFSREKVGRIQFSEEWYFDEDNLRMEKRVNSLTLGYEVYDYEGNLRGYKPAFLVKLN